MFAQKTVPSRKLSIVTTQNSSLVIPNISHSACSLRQRSETLWALFCRAPADSRHLNATDVVRGSVGAAPNLPKGCGIPAESADLADGFVLSRNERRTGGSRMLNTADSTMPVSPASGEWSKKRARAEFDEKLDESSRRTLRHGTSKLRIIKVVLANLALWTSTLDIISISWFKSFSMWLQLFIAGYWTKYKNKKKTNMRKVGKDVSFRSWMVPYRRWWATLSNFLMAKPTFLTRFQNSVPDYRQKIHKQKKPIKKGITLIGREKGTHDFLYPISICAIFSILRIYFNK